MPTRRLPPGTVTLAVVLAALMLALALRSGAEPHRTAEATAQDWLFAEVSPAGCATIRAKLASDSSMPEPATEWTFPDDAHVRVTATAVEGCSFERWELIEDGEVLWTATTNPFSFQLLDEATVKAHFTGWPASIPTPTPTPAPTPTPTPAPSPCTQTTLGVEPSANSALDSDCAALLRARDALRGTATLNWSAETAMSSWDGVSLGGTPQRVRGLSLVAKELTGSIPTGLGSLGELRTLNLSRNRLTGAIPAELGNLTRLTSLWLRANSLTGAIPGELGRLAKLRELMLHNNQLSGSIPAQLGDLKKLQRLRLDGNQLTGRVPRELARLTELTHLYLAKNMLIGCVPAEFESVATSDLEALALPACPPPVFVLQATANGKGSVSPAGRTEHTPGATVTLTARWNSVTHRFAGWGGACSGTATTCVVTMNQVRTVTATFASLCADGTAVPAPAGKSELVRDCERLLLLEDTLSGTGALNWSAGTAMSSWTGVSVGGTPQRVTGLSLARSGLTGELSGLLGTLTGLEQLRLDGNSLTGRIPSKLGQLVNLTDLYLEGNPLTGCIPAALWDAENHDIAALGLSTCPEPTDISSGGHTLGAGSYRFALADGVPPLIFDLPAGVRLETVGIVISDSGAGPDFIGLILELPGGGSWICLDLERSEECGRRVGSAPAGGASGSAGAASGAPGVGSAFDRISESLWREAAP